MWVSGVGVAGWRGATAGGAVSRASALRRQRPAFLILSPSLILTIRHYYLLYIIRGVSVFENVAHGLAPLAVVRVSVAEPAGPRPHRTRYYRYYYYFLLITLYSTLYSLLYSTPYLTHYSLLLTDSTRLVRLLYRISLSDSPSRRAPSSPLNLTIKNITSTEIHLTWTKPAESTFPPPEIVRVAENSDVAIRRRKRTKTEDSDEGQNNATSPSLVYILYYEEGSTGDDPDEWKGGLVETRDEIQSRVSSVDLVHDTKDNNRDSKGVKYTLKDLSGCF